MKAYAIPSPMEHAPINQDLCQSALFTIFEPRLRSRKNLLVVSWREIVRSRPPDRPLYLAFHSSTTTLRHINRPIVNSQIWFQHVGIHLNPHNQRSLLQRPRLRSVRRSKALNQHQPRRVDVQGQFLPHGRTRPRPRHWPGSSYPYRLSSGTLVMCLEDLTRCLEANSTTQSGLPMPFTAMSTTSTVGRLLKHMTDSRQLRQS